MPRWPAGRARDGGIDRIPLPHRAGLGTGAGADAGSLWLCGKHAVGPDPDGALARVGATTMVCLTERHELADRYPEYVSWLDTHRGERVAWLPIPDLHAPGLDDTVALIDVLGRRVLAGEHLLVHCAAGIGRSGTVATCLLVSLGADVDVALATVAAHRPMAGPEVGAQMELVRAYASWVADRTGRAAP